MVERELFKKKARQKTR